MMKYSYDHYSDRANVSMSLTSIRIRAIIIRLSLRFFSIGWLGTLEFRVETWNFSRNAIN